MGQLMCPGERLLANALTLGRQQSISAIPPGTGRPTRRCCRRCLAVTLRGAGAWLGHAYCYPDWGVTPNRERGMRMIREVYWHGARLSPDWFLDKDVCPAPKP